MPAGAEAPAGVRRDWAQLGVSAFLILVGSVLIGNAMMLSNNRTGTDPLGPRTFPLFIGIILLVLAVCLAIATWRGSVPDIEGGEDVDVTQKTDWVTVGLLLGVFIANIVLIDILGWVISGALLFYGCALVLGNRRYIVTLLIGVALSLGTFYGFAIGLGIPLPAGILRGIL